MFKKLKMLKKELIVILWNKLNLLISSEIAFNHICMVSIF